MGELHHKIILYTVPFHEMDEIDPTYRLSDLTQNADDRAIAKFYSRSPKTNLNRKYTAREWREWRRAAKSCEMCGYIFQRESEKQGDHVHSTGEWRGVLCVTCNIFLGYVEKNPALPDLAKRYLGRVAPC